MLQISDESGTPEGRYEECSEYENLPGHVLNTKYLNDLVLEVQRKTGKILIAVLFYFDRRNIVDEILSENTILIIFVRYHGHAGNSSLS